jgi:hypothetical protein
MPKKDHHYVPKFYLRNFSSKPKHIHIFNLNSNLVHQDGSIKGQCYKKHFHGPTDELENELEKYETKIAPALRRVVQSELIPRSGTDDFHLLLWFLALQSTRTLSHTNRTVEILKQSLNIAFGDEGRQDPSVLAKYPDPTPLEVTQNFIKTSKHVLITLVSLGLHLVINRTKHKFLTSDNPVFKYNLYCEGVEGTGIVGTARSGFIMFTPLSPEVMLVLFDKDVYKLGVRRSDHSVITEDKDIHSLNLMQAVGADAALLFSDWADKDHVRDVAARSMKYRSRPRSNVVECKSTDPSSPRSLIAMHDTTPNLSLKLTFLSLIKKSRRISMSKRIISYRNGTGMERTPLSSPGSGETFVRPDRR